MVVIFFIYLGFRGAAGLEVDVGLLVFVWKRLLPLYLGTVVREVANLEL